MLYKAKATLSASVALLALADVATAAPEQLNCVQQAFHVCTQDAGCTVPPEPDVRQWAFVLDAEANKGTFRPCWSGRCQGPFSVTVTKSGEHLQAWDPVTNEVFSFSSDRKVFAHARVAAFPNGGATQLRFGYCVKE